jgi:hypothetical protein
MIAGVIVVHIDPARSTHVRYWWGTAEVFSAVGLAGTVVLGGVTGGDQQKQRQQPVGKGRDGCGGDPDRRSGPG